MPGLDMKVALPQGEMISLLLPETLGNEALLRNLVCVQREAGDHLDVNTAEKLANLLASPPPPHVSATMVDPAPGGHHHEGFWPLLGQEREDLGDFFRGNI